jgi:hypothetical protein
VKVEVKGNLWERRFGKDYLSSYWDIKDGTIRENFHWGIVSLGFQLVPAYGKNGRLCDFGSALNEVG